MSGRIDSKQHADGRRFATEAVHAGERPCPHTGAVATPIYQTASFAFADADQGAARFAGDDPGFIYSRLGNPTQQALEEKIARLEGAEAAVAFASGMGAVSALLLDALRPGDHVVVDKAVYASTQTFLGEWLPRWGVEADFVDAASPDAIRGALQTNTRVLYVETPGNPTMSLVDLQSVANIARKAGCTTICDNTFMTPYLQLPLEWGIDAVVHSATKYLGGHGDAISGLAVGAAATMSRIRSTVLRDVGAVISPFNAWLVLRGMTTLPLRMERHTANAGALARYLADHGKVARVHYPGLPDHPQYELACRQMHGFGGMLSFELSGGYDAGRTLINALQLCTLAVSLGDVRTLVQHPASMSHSAVPRDRRLEAGLSDGLIRMSVGIEHPDDLLADLEQALARC